MKDLLYQIKRFQELGKKTGRSKSSSYYVEFNFSPTFYIDDKVTITFGGYDITNWGRHHIVESSGVNLLEDITKEVDKAVKDTECIYYCENCKEYTQHDGLKCLGYGCE